MEHNITHNAPHLLTREAARPQFEPAAPRGHYSHTGNVDSLATLARLAHDPAQPRYIRRWHRAALENSLEKLASLVRSISRPVTA